MLPTAGVCGRTFLLSGGLSLRGFRFLVREVARYLPEKGPKSYRQLTISQLFQIYQATQDHFENIFPRTLLSRSQRRAPLQQMRLESQHFRILLSELIALTDQNIDLPMQAIGDTFLLRTIF